MRVAETMGLRSDQSGFFRGNNRVGISLLQR